MDIKMTMPLILNILLASIPEEIFFVIFSLIIMKRLDLIGPKKKNIIRIATIVISVAISSNTLRACSIIDGNTAPIYGIISIFILTKSLFSIKTVKSMTMAFLSICLTFLVAFSIELILYPVFSNIPGLNVEEANRLGWLPIILSIPERMIQIVLVVTILIKRKSFMTVGFLKVIVRNRALSYITGSLIVFNLMFLYIMFRLIFQNNILGGADSITKVFTVVMVIVFPLLNMSVLLSIINFFVNKSEHTKIFVQDETKVLKILLNLLIRERRYDELDYQIDTFINEINEIK